MTVRAVSNIFIHMRHENDKISRAAPPRSKFIDMLFKWNRYRENTRVSMIMMKTKALNSNSMNSNHLSLRNPKRYVMKTGKASMKNKKLKWANNELGRKILVLKFESQMSEGATANISAVHSSALIKTAMPNKRHT